ncbi:hypothetical protein A9Q68_07275 [Streptococcus bovimastitidis]|uniref:Histidine kinase n=1 Tax=Streptococcus bovimastitidis TaxID=1856638 RepID=A0A1L8MLZ7_9STRE|nr:hypothetical protein [Streptococcus bovimastitidis]OJF71782.1 hypothetical protein A9Q68_07275 [Streptococcus bovimastitidis]
MLDITATVFLTRFLTSWTIFFLLTTEKNRLFKVLILTLVEAMLYLYLHIPFVILEPLMMLVYRRKAYPNDGIFHLIYYISFPIVITSLFSSLMIFFVFPFLFDMTTLAVWKSPEIELLSYISVVPLLTFVEEVFAIQTFRFKHDYLKVIYRLLIISDIFLLIYLTGFYYFEVNNSSGGESIWISKLLILFFIFVFLFLSSYINHYGKVRSERYIELVEEQYLLALENYNVYIENTYQTIRSFKHDYENLMISLAGSLEHNDPRLIHRITRDILAKMGNEAVTINQLYDEKFQELMDKDLEFFLSQKFYELENKGVLTSVQILNPIDNLHILTMDFIVLLTAIFKFINTTIPKNENATMTFVFNSDMHGTGFLIIESTYDKFFKSINNLPKELVEQNNLIFDYLTDKYSNIFIYRNQGDSVFQYRINITNPKSVE